MYGWTRKLARAPGQDVGNVHGDLRLLHRLRFVAFESGAGRRRAPRLAGDCICTELGPDVQRNPRDRERRILEAEACVPLDEAADSLPPEGRQARGRPSCAPGG